MQKERKYLIKEVWMTGGGNRDNLSCIPLTVGWVKDIVGRVEEGDGEVWRTVGWELQ